MTDQKSSDAIPIRRVVIRDPSQLPPNHGTTPGGTLFGTTPGGTRIIYERDFILNCRNSPIAHSPPPNMVHLPGLTFPDADGDKLSNINREHLESNSLRSNDANSFDKNELHKDDSPFEMDV